MIGCLSKLFKYKFRKFNIKVYKTNFFKRSKNIYQVFYILNLINNLQIVEGILGCKSNGSVFVYL